jgi:hypothetical protein
MSLAVCLSVFGWPNADVHAQVCQRTAQDCGAQTADLDRQVARLRRQHPGVPGEALEVIRLDRRSACHAHNACLLDDAGLARTQAWAEAELRALGTMQGDAAEAAWASGVAQRLTLIRGANASQVALTPSIPPEMRARMQVTIDQMTTQNEELSRFAALLSGLDQQLEPRRRRRRLEAPAACVPALREQLRTMVRQGHDMASEARSIMQKLDEVCEPFELWDEPNESIQGRIRRFLEHVGRIEGWMADIGECHAAANYEFRCSNAYGERNASAIEEAREVLALMREVRTVMRGVPGRRFPCGHALWRRLRESTWTVRTATAQVPRLGASAVDVCEAIGVDPANLQEARTDVTNTLERTLARIAQRRTQNEQTIVRLRQAYNIPAP